LKAMELYSFIAAYFISLVESGRISALQREDAN